MNKQLKNLIVLVMAAMLVCPVFTQAADRAHTLKVYNWADYIDMENVLTEGCQKGSATASPMLRATEPLSDWRVMFVAAASPQGAGARRVYHILGIADAAKNIFAICRRLSRAELQA